MSDWLLQNIKFEGPTNIDEMYGMVYKITNLEDGRFYIGAKFFWKPHYKTTKGKKKKSWIESDWKDYWSSSEALKEDVKKLGEDKFKREILHLVKYRGMVKYLETKEIFANNCLERPLTECYNSIVSCKIHRRCVRE